jgi:hypothetical protein
MGLRALAIGAAAIVLVLAQRLPATAQFGLTSQPAVPPYEVLAIVRSKGLEPLSRPQRHGGSYTLRAVDPRGREFQVTVDARMARITKIAPFVRQPAAGAQANAPPRVAPDGLSPNSRIVHGAEGQVAEEEEGGLPGAAPRSSGSRRMQPLPEVPPLPRPRPQMSTPASSDAAFYKAPEEEPPKSELEE